MRALRALARWMEWRAAVVLGITAFGSSGLSWLTLQRQAVEAGASIPLAVVGTLVWTSLSVVLLVRRRIGARDGAAMIGVVVALLAVEGLTYADTSLKWMCVGSLVVAPIAAVMLLQRRGIMLTTAACIAGAAAVVMGLDEPDAIRTYALSTVVALVVVPVTVVATLIHQLERARDLARRLASTDQLTGLLNRRGMHEQLPDRACRALASGQALRVVLLDLDHFKAVNDVHGHDVGDAVLAGVATALAGVARADDLLVRLGGEEFAWIMSLPDAHQGALAAERARRVVHDLRAEGAPPVTVSIGTAALDPCPCTEDGSDQGALAAILSRALVQADRALYEAKRTGRDRVVHVEDLPAGPAPAPTPPGSRTPSAPTDPSGRSLPSGSAPAP